MSGFFFLAHTSLFHYPSSPAARYIFLDFQKKKIQKGCRCIRAMQQFMNT